MGNVSTGVQVAFRVAESANALPTDTAQPLGRSELRRADVDYEQVQMLAAAGWSEIDIATVVGISRGSLRKYYSDELRLGGLRCRAQILHALYRSAVCPGRLAASKAFLAIMDAAAAAEQRSLQPDSVPPLHVVAS